MARAKLKEHAAHIITNLVRGDLRMRKEKMVPEENLYKIRRHLKAFTRAVR